MILKGLEVPCRISPSDPVGSLGEARHVYLGLFWAEMAPDGNTHVLSGFWSSLVATVRGVARPSRRKPTGGPRNLVRVQGAPSASRLLSRVPLSWC